MIRFATDEEVKKFEVLFNSLHIRSTTSTLITLLQGRFNMVKELRGFVDTETIKKFCNRKILLSILYETIERECLTQNYYIYMQEGKNMSDIVEVSQKEATILFKERFNV